VAEKIEDGQYFLKARFAAVMPKYPAVMPADPVFPAEKRDLQKGFIVAQLPEGDDLLLVKIQKIALGPIPGNLIIIQKILSFL